MGCLIVVDLKEASLVFLVLRILLLLLKAKYVLFSLFPQVRVGVALHKERV